MKQGVATVADAWRPTSELERRLGDAVRSGDQEGYFRLLAESELVVPVPPDMIDDVLANERQPTWPTQAEDDRTFVLVYTSPDAMRACLGPSYRHYMRVRFTDLAGAWPDARWWLAVDVPSQAVQDISLPIEGRLPAWFVQQLAQGDARPPLAGHHPSPSALSGPPMPQATTGAYPTTPATPPGRPPASPAAPARNTTSPAASTPPVGPGQNSAPAAVPLTGPGGEAPAGAMPPAAPHGSAYPPSAETPRAPGENTAPPQPYAPEHPAAEETSALSHPAGPEQPPGESAPAPQHAPFGSVEHPTRGAAFGPGEQPTPDAAFGAGERPASDASFGSGEHPTREAAYGPGEQPTSDAAFGAGGQPARDAAFAAGERPATDASFGSGEHPTRDAAYGPGEQVASDAAFGAGGQAAAGRAGEGGAPGGRAPEAAFGSGEHPTRTPGEAAEDGGRSDDPTATIPDLSVYAGSDAAQDPRVTQAMPAGDVPPPTLADEPGAGFDTERPLPPGVANMPPVPEPPAPADEPDPAEASPAATSVDPIPVVRPRADSDAPWEELQGQHRELPRAEPRPEFQPANEVEQSLLRAATGNDHDLFLQTLADAEVLLPVGPDADFTLRPGRAGFQWQTREVDGATLVQVFTSPERLAEATRAAGAGAESIRVPFPLVLRYWPEHANALAVNPGSPAGGTILAEQLPGLATWADQRAARRMSEGFEAQNEVEQRLFDAALRRDTDAFFKVLLGAQVLVPADPETPWGITPDDPEFPWRPARVHGRVAIQLFTSLRWMNEAVGSSRFVMPTFLEVVAAWPDADWTLVLNPGTPVDAAIPGEQVRALSGPVEQAPAEEPQVAETSAADAAEPEPQPEAQNGPEPEPEAQNEPEPEFEPGNRIDQELFEAALGGDSDAFLRVLLAANVLVPIPQDAPLEVTPTQREFRWEASLRGSSAVQVFTSLVRLREVLPESRFVYADFRELIAAWPNDDWAMLLNPGTRIGASLRGDQVRALSEWAVRVGLVQPAPEPEPDPYAPPSAPESFAHAPDAADPSAYAQTLGEPGSVPASGTPAATPPEPAAFPGEHPAAPAEFTSNAPSNHPADASAPSGPDQAAPASGDYGLGGHGTPAPGRPAPTADGYAPDGLGTAAPDQPTPASREGLGAGAPGQGATASGEYGPHGLGTGTPGQAASSDGPGASTPGQEASAAQEYGPNGLGNSAAHQATPDEYAPNRLGTGAPDQAATASREGLGTGAAGQGATASGEYGPNGLGTGASHQAAPDEYDSNGLGSGAPDRAASASREYGPNGVGSDASDQAAFAAREYGPNGLGSGVPDQDAATAGGYGPDERGAGAPGQGASEAREYAGDGFGTDAAGQPRVGAAASGEYGPDGFAAGRGRPDASAPGATRIGEYGPDGASRPGEYRPGASGGAGQGGREAASYDGVTAFGAASERQGVSDGEPGAEPTIMQKVVPHAHVAWYLEQGYDRVGGFVHPTADVAELQTPGQLYEALGLLYEESPFAPADDTVHVIRWPAYCQDLYRVPFARPDDTAHVTRWPAYCQDLYRVPFGGQTEEEVAAWGEAGWVLERPPFGGTGFAPGSAGSIREYKVDSVRLPFGAEMYALGRDGSEAFVAMYDPDRLAWLRPEGATPGPRTEAAR